MKCGHPDVMKNLYWAISGPRCKTRGANSVLELGGSWICRVCAISRVRKYSRTYLGVLNNMKKNIVERRRARANA